MASGPPNYGCAVDAPISCAPAMKSHDSSQVCNFADDNTIFACGETLDEVAICIEDDKREAMNSYKRNEMVAYPDKFQLSFFGLKEDQDLCIDIRCNVIKMSETVKLLGVSIDSKLNFDRNIKTICYKTKNKVQAFQGLQVTLTTKSLASYTIHLY